MKPTTTAGALGASYLATVLAAVILHPLGGVFHVGHLALLLLAAAAPVYLLASIWCEAQRAPRGSRAVAATAASLALAVALHPAAYAALFDHLQPQGLFAEAIGLQLAQHQARAGLAAYWLHLPSLLLLAWAAAMPRLAAWRRRAQADDAWSPAR